MRFGMTLLCLLMTTGAFAAERLPLRNGNFEAVNTRGRAADWSATQHAGVRAYEIRADHEIKRSGDRSLMIRRFREQVFGSITQTVDTSSDLVGATVRFEVWIRAEAVQGKGAVVRIDSVNGTSYMERVDSARITGTSDWQRIRVEMLVPTYTNNLRPSISLDGDGTIWIDDAKLTVLERARK